MCCFGLIFQSFSAELVALKSYIIMYIARRNTIRTGSMSIEQHVQGMIRRKRKRKAMLSRGNG
jgi:hypothetical protein